jgi:membrane-associated phospholipid phosphatase
MNTLTLNKTTQSLHKFLIVFLLVAFQLSAVSQEARVETKPETKAEKEQEHKPYSFTQFGHETFLFVKQPTLWKGKDWLRVGLIAAATMAVMPFDQPLINSTQGNQRYNNSVFIVGGRMYGEWYAIGGVASVFGIYGLIAKDDRSKKISIELIQAGVYAELITHVLKNTIGRARPYTNEGAFSYHPFSFFDIDYNSMPSGHTTSAMALSTVMSRHANKTVFKILAYAPAAFTMFSRIYQNQHYLSDEILACGIGYFVGNWVVDLHEGKRHRINVASVYPRVTISVNLNRQLTQR